MSCFSKIDNASYKPTDFSATKVSKVVRIFIKKKNGEVNLRISDLRTRE